MATFHNLYNRLTFKYISAYRDLDQMEYVGDVVIPAWTVTAEGQDYDEGSTMFTMIRRPVKIPHEHFVAGLENEFNYSGCSHEYDCCGCASSYATIRRMGNRKYYVRRTIRYNY